MAESGVARTGVVIRFHDRKGYGFIKPDDGGEDLFVHQSEIQSEVYRSLHEGQKVKFIVVDKNDKQQAVNVAFLDPVVVRGTRNNGGCYNCGGFGHLAMECSRSGPRGGNDGGGGSGGCGNCSEYYFCDCFTQCLKNIV